MMSKNEMQKIIEEELTHIPRIKDNLPQNLLRSIYHSSRLHGIKVGIKREETLKSCIENQKKENPTWQPTYDKEYFNL